jgi:hypothetical protein
VIGRLVGGGGKVMYLKITNKEEKHHGLQYRDGLVEDIVPFLKLGSCVPGGIYFTAVEYICRFLGYGVWVREVIIPEGAKIVGDPEGDKWRADKVVLSSRRDLGEVETWKWLEENGVDIHSYDEAALKYATSRGYLEVVKYLVERGANIHIRNDEFFIISAENGYLEVVKYLVEHGANIHAWDDEALRTAASRGHIEVVKYLVENGADIHVWSSLRNAAVHGHLEIVKYLIEQGANIHALDDWALRYASEDRHLEVVKYLKSLV